MSFIFAYTASQSHSCIVVLGQKEVLEVEKVQELNILFFLYLSFFTGMFNEVKQVDINFFQDRRRCWMCKRYQSLIFYSSYISLFFTVRTHNLGVEIAILQERLRKLNKNFVGNKRRCCKVEKVHCIRIGHSGLKG